MNNDNKQASDSDITSLIDEPVDKIEPVIQSTDIPNNSSKPNAIQSQDYSSAFLDKSGFNYTFSLPSISLKNLSEKLVTFSNLSIDDKNSNFKAWKELTEESVEFYTPKGLYQDRFTDDKSLYKQGVSHPENIDELNTISVVKFKKSEGEIKGEAALLKVTKLLGLGDIVNVPLPHSGIWVTIKPPTERDVIDFYNNIFREKIILGRATTGLTLTNFSVYFNNKLLDFILKHVHSLNYGDIPKEELKDYLLIHDFHILAWGFACSMYPNGFDFERACVNNIEECSHIDKATINMAKLLWIDNKSLTQQQLQILSETRSNKLTRDNYSKFIAEHNRVSTKLITINSNIKLNLKVPTFTQYVTDGLSWINKLNSAIDSVIMEEGSDEKTKTELLNQYVKSSILRQFNHFVDYIEIDDNTVQDRDTINTILEAFSANDDIRPIITEKILEYKADTTLGLIGIPDYTCPKCGFNQNTDPVNSKLVNVIPLDVMHVFFTLLTIKVARVTERLV